ncbi:heparinase II/III family protein [Fibrobacterota bacterium]
MVRYGMPVLGLSGHVHSSDLYANKQNAHELLSPNHRETAGKVLANISDSYKLIDWQRDFKSGFRWMENEWNGEQEQKLPPGADVKVPWELGRFQHMVQLAVFTKVVPEYLPEIVREFKDQVRDFIAMNPPGMGIQWGRAMEAGIRAVNLLLTYDLLKQTGGLDDREFEELFCRSIFQHGLFIEKNLEFYNEYTGNHYIANIAGLLFISAYLDKVEDSTKWLLFSARELIYETLRQFNEEGSNFEASTSYHRLSSEMVLCCASLMLGLPGEKQRILARLEIGEKHASSRVHQEGGSGLVKPRDWEAFQERVYKLGWYTSCIIKHNDEVPQFGDNDSGRFIKLTPVGNWLTNSAAEETYANLKGYHEYLISEGLEEEDAFWDENDLNHLPLVSLWKAAFKKELIGNKADLELENSFISGLSKGEKFKIGSSPSMDAIDKSDRTTRNDEILKYQDETRYMASGQFGRSLRDNLKSYRFHSAGHYIFKSDRMYLAVTTKPARCIKGMGHVHNDILAYELMIDNSVLSLDPGTYVYTPLQEMRNRFRSAFAHNTAYFGQEQDPWPEGDRGVFLKEDAVTCELINISNDACKFKAYYADVIHLREFKIFDNHVLITDKSNRKMNLVKNRLGLYSCGYGKLQDLKTIS